MGNSSGSFNDPEILVFQREFLMNHHDIPRYIVSRSKVKSKSYVKNTYSTIRLIKQATHFTNSSGFLRDELSATTYLKLSFIRDKTNTIFYKTLFQKLQALFMLKVLDK